MLRDRKKIQRPSAAAVTMTVVSLFAFGFACGGNKKNKQVESPKEVPVSTVVGEPLGFQVDRNEHLLVATPKGIVAFDFDGNKLDVISKSKATGLRWFSENELVFWEPTKRALMFLDVKTKEESELLEVSFSCKKKKKMPPLRVQNAADASIIKSTRLCYSLLDKAPHKATAWVQLQFEMLTKESSYDVVLPDACSKAYGEQEEDLCGAHVDDMHEETAVPDQAKFYVREGVLFSRSKTEDWQPVASDLLGLEPNMHDIEWSGDGTWFVVSGGESEENFGAMKWLLVNAVSGEAFPLGRKQTKWPEALLVSKLTGPSLKGDVSFVPRTEFPVWVGNLLLVGKTLYFPKQQRVLPLSGELAL